MTTSESNQRPKAYGVLYGSFFAILPAHFVLMAVLPEKIAGFRSFDLVSIAAVFAWLILLVRFVPRCPNCGLGYFSVIEAKRFPVIFMGWVSRHCFGCGKELK